MRNPQFKGVFGFGGHESATEALDDADLILALGTALGELATGNWNPKLMNGNLVHIDENIDNLSNSMIARRHIHTSLPKFFRTINASLSLDAAHKPSKIGHMVPSAAVQAIQQNGSEQIIVVDWEKNAPENAPIKPQYLMEDMSNRLPEDARILVDAGNAWAWATHYLHTKNSEGYYRTSFKFGAMAWAI